MKDRAVRLVAIILAATLLLVGCTQAAPAPTAAPAAPTKAAEAAKPTAAPAAPTVAPAAAPTTAAAPKVNYPEKGKTINMIVPFAAGGPTDIAARLMAPVLEKELGVPVQVVNKPGAAAQIGIGEVARAKPDGYTIGAALQPPSVIAYLDKANPATFSRKDLQPVAMYAMDSYVLAVKADGPYKTVKDLIDAAKAKPDAVKFSTTGPTSGAYISADLLAKRAGVQFATVSFDSGAQQVMAILGDTVDATMCNGSVAVSQVRNNSIRLLGILSNEENKFFPGVKPLPAQGYDVVLGASHGLIVPAGTPMEVHNKLRDAVKNAITSPAYEDTRKKMEELTYVPTYMDTAEYNKHWDETEVAVKAVFAAAGR